MRSKHFSAAFVALALLSPEAASAATRPATTNEAALYASADAHLERAGVAVGPYRVLVTEPDVAECSPGADNPGFPAYAYACALPGTVYLSPDAAAHARAYHRYRARCLYCPDAAQTALHELVHVARMTYRPFRSWVPSEYAYEEGLAEAVAYDQAPIMIRRATRTRVEPIGYAYTHETDAVRRLHPTRRARLAAVRDPNPPPTIHTPQEES